MKIERINNWFESTAKTIIKRKWIYLTLFVLIVGFSFTGLKKMVVESSWDGYFLEDDPMLVKTDEFKEIFGNDNFIAVLTQSEDSFTKQSLELIRELSNELLDSLSYAEKITSLTDIEYMKGTDFGMEIQQIVPEIIPNDKESLEKIRVKAYSKPNIAEKLISKDGKLTWIILKLRTFPEKEEWSKNNKLSPEFITGQEADKIVKKEKYKSISPKATGLPYITFKKQVYFGKEGKRVMGFAFLIAIIVLIIATKSLRGVIIPLITSISAIIIIYGNLGHLKFPIDSGMMTIPILLSFAIAIAYNIHVFSFFRKHFNFYGKRKQAIIEAIKEMGWPILFSALTTMSALLTFLIIPMRPLRFAGVATAVCVLLTFLIVLFVVPCLMSIGKNKKPNPELIKKGGRWLDRKMGLLGVWVLNNPKKIIFTSIILAVYLFIGITKVDTAFDIEKTMGRKIEYVDNILTISETELGSIYSYDLLIEFPENGDAKKVTNLKKLEKINNVANSLELTKKTTSILDIVKDLNRTINENNESYFKIADNQNQIAQLLLLYENAGGSESEYWIDYDYKRLRMQVEIAQYNSGQAEKELETIQNKAKAIFSNAKITTVGSLPQFTTMMQYVVRGQVQSFLTALLIIAILLMIVFGSVKIGLIGMIPNIAPALVVGGLMGWMDIPLDMMTATIIPMVLGLAVDDTIHFINHGHLEFKRKGNYQGAIMGSFKVVGIALVLSSAVISANFIVYSTSNALQFVNLGLLAIAGILAALFSDLLITPILFKTFKIFGKETNKYNQSKKENSTKEIETPIYN